MKSLKLKKICVCAMLTALAYLCTFIFRFKVSFLTFDFKDAIISIISLLYGPLYGIASAGIVSGIEALSVSDTGIYGFIMNFLSTATFSLTCGLIYKYKRTFSGAIIAVSMSVISVTSVMLLANIFITPFYLGVKTADVIAFLPTLILPFNLSKAIINSAVILLIYKPIISALRRAKLVLSEKNESAIFSLKSVILIISSVIIIILIAVFLIKVMGGTFETI